MPEFKLQITSPRPFFAELPYYVWGRVNYDSEGNCKNPLDCGWTWIELTNRETKERLEISSDETVWTISGADPAASRIAHFLQRRCDGEWIAGLPQPDVGVWDHEQAANRAKLVATTFRNDLLVPFAVRHMFWGSWKWIGWFATDFTWVGRWIMDSLVRNDMRAVNLCIEWLRGGTFAETQSVALRYALVRFTGMSFGTDEEWVQWYDNAGGKTLYPAPDFDAWFEDLKVIHGE